MSEVFWMNVYRPRPESRRYIYGRQHPTWLEADRASVDVGAALVYRLKVTLK